MPKEVIYSGAHNAPERVPSRAIGSFQPDPLVEAQPILAVPRLRYLEPGHGRSQVAAKTLGIAGVLSALGLAPLTPSLEQPIDLDSDPALITHRSRRNAPMGLPKSSSCCTASSADRGCGK